jgi:hypothetical protein
MEWCDVELGAPELAALVQREFERTGMALVGTLTRSGAPRVSCCDPVVVDGALCIGMMWRSRKAVDLLRDPRLVLHNAIASNRGDEDEVVVRGAARELRDAVVRARFLEKTADRARWVEPFHLFIVDIESVAEIRYGGGEQRVRVWPAGTERRRTY